MSETTGASCTSDQVGQLTTDEQTSSLGAFSQVGTFYPLCLLSVNEKQPQIIDSGASDHLTGSSYGFLTYSPCAGNEKN